MALKSCGALKKDSFHNLRAVSFKRLLGGGYREAPGCGGGSPCCAIFSMTTRKRHFAARNRKLAHTAPPTRTLWHPARAVD